MARALHDLKFFNPHAHIFDNMPKHPHKLKQPTKTTLVNSEEDNHGDDDQSIATPLLPIPSAGPKRGKSAARTNRAGVSVAVQQELAEYIEKLYGGIEAFASDPYSTNKVCRQKPDIYGEGTSQVCQSVRDKLKQWKKFSQQEYEKL